MLFNINNKLAQLLGFETQSAEDIKMEKELRELSREDVIHSIKIYEPKAEKKEDDVVEKEEITQDVVETPTDETISVSVENNEIEQETNVETQEETQVATTESEEQTGSEDVSEDTVVDETQSATEPKAESEEQPLNEVSDIEPSDLIHSAETEQSVQSEQVEVTQVATNVEENVTEGIEPSSETETVATDIAESGTEVAEVAIEPDNAKIDIPAPSNETIEELERVKQELAQMKAKEAEQALKLEKAEIEREVNQDYAGIPLSTNETVDFLYEIKNSVLNEGTKDFIFNSLKQLSSSNLKDCQEVGHQLNVEPKSEKEILNEKIKQAQNEFDLTEGQALLYVTGARNLKQAKDATSKARRRK